MSNEKRLIDPKDFLDLFYVASAGQDKAFIKAVEMVVEDTPTVDAVEVVHGRWNIEWEYERDCITGECDENPVATCPFCGHKEWGFAYDEYWGKPYNYCPNCGAKMDGGNEDG